MEVRTGAIYCHYKVSRIQTLSGSKCRKVGDNGYPRCRFAAERRNIGDIRDVAVAPRSGRARGRAKRKGDRATFHIDRTQCQAYIWRTSRVKGLLFRGRKQCAPVGLSPEECFDRKGVRDERSVPTWSGWLAESKVGHRSVMQPALSWLCLVARTSPSHLIKTSEPQVG